MKLCKDCRFFRLPNNQLDISEYAKCVYGMRTSPVTGDASVKTQSSFYCLSNRTSENPLDCGPDARFFQHAKIALVSSLPTEPVPA